MAEIDTLIQIVQKRRSIRKFKQDPVRDADMVKIIEAARWAASAANTQPWEFIAVREQETKERIAEIFVRALDGKREKDEAFPYGPPGKAEKLLVKKFIKAPLLLAVCSDPRFKEALPREDSEELFLLSMGAVMEHIHLAVAALGLASAWGSVSEDVDKRLKGVLGIPDALRVLEVFAIGYPDMDPIPKHCRTVEEMLHQEKFDQDKWRTEQEIKDLISSRRFPDLYSGRKDD